MKLTKTVDDTNLTVVFEARQPLPDEEAPEQEAEGEEEEAPSENYCDFTVYFEKGGKGMAVECTTMDTEINFLNVQHTDNV